jgi:hypothetical protein
MLREYALAESDKGKCGKAGEMEQGEQEMR